MNLEGKIAVVVGASGGIGREVSKALAKGGAEVILISDRREMLEALQKEILHEGGKVHLFTSDLSKKTQIVDLAAKIGSKFAKVDILFHTAGYGVYKKLTEVSFEEWEKSFSVNVDSVFLLTQKLIPQLTKSSKAYVISAGSGMGKIALSGRSTYCASKFALRGLMLSLAKEYKETNIKFVLLTMGSILTSFGPLTVEEKKKKQEKGKEYLDPVWLAHHIITKIGHDTLEDEVPIYPSHYFEESRKDRR